MVPALEGQDWLREVLHCISGIQRKSKGRGGLARFVFHQSSEFCVLYAGAPKSAVHLIITPARLIRRADIGPSEASLIHRMACYAAHLCNDLREAFPSLQFSSGLRLRPGRTQQFHGHLLSLDLVAPRVTDLDRRDFEDFVTGPSTFLPLQALAERLLSGSCIPSGPEASALGHRRSALVCHRCGALFGDDFAQLQRHLGVCDVWPPAASKRYCDSGGKRQSDEEVCDALRQVEELRWRELAQLEEMGFGGCGQDALLAALASEGSLERAVALLSVR